MKKRLTRIETLQLIMAAIDMPLLVVQIELDNKIYLVKDYPQLKKIIEEELYILSISVSI